MKDPFAAIRKGYVDSLADASVKVYDESVAAGVTDKAYILLSTQTSSNDRNKDAFKNDCTLLVDVVVKTMNTTGKKRCDDIADEISTIINPIKGPFVNAGSDFQVINTTLIGNNTLHSMSDSEHVYRRLLRFSHKVLEK